MNVSTKQQRIAELAKQQPEMSFTSLNHYLDSIGKFIFWSSKALMNQG